VCRCGSQPEFQSDVLPLSISGADDYGSSNIGFSIDTFSFSCGRGLFESFESVMLRTHSLKRELVCQHAAHSPTLERYGKGGVAERSGGYF